MRFAVVALALGACNQLYGLEPTESIAVFLDAPIDAPFHCPNFGETPQFSRLLHQIPQTCVEWTGSLVSGKALAMCYEPLLQVAQGPIEGPVVPIVGFETVNKVHFDAVRTLPDGDQVLIRRWDESSVVGELRVYNRGANDVLTYSHEIKLPDGRTTDAFIRVGSPSRGPMRRMFTNLTGLGLAEIEFDETGASTLIATYTEADLGVQQFTGLPPNITGDGLRMTFLGSGGANAVFYSDRTSVTEKFRGARPIVGVPAIDSFMTDDCERLYFGALGSVLYVQQL